MAVEKNPNPGAVLELPAKQHCQFGPFTKKPQNPKTPKPRDLFALVELLKKNILGANVEKISSMKIRQDYSS